MLWDFQFFFVSNMPSTYAAMLAYKSVQGTKNLKKLVHLTLQLTAFILSLIGVWAALKFHIDKGIENFYSLHSWLGLACLFLFAFQVHSLLTSLKTTISITRKNIYQELKSIVTNSGLQGL